jgi:hypothetical protein
MRVHVLDLAAFDGVQASTVGRTQLEFYWEALVFELVRALLAVEQFLPLDCNMVVSLDLFVIFTMSFVSLEKSAFYSLVLVIERVF